VERRETAKLLTGSGREKMYRVAYRRLSLHVIRLSPNSSHGSIVRSLAYVMASDPEVCTRTWQHVMNEIVKTEGPFCQPPFFPESTSGQRKSEVCT